MQLDGTYEQHATNCLPQNVTEFPPITRHRGQQSYHGNWYGSKSQVSVKWRALQILEDGPGNQCCSRSYFYLIIWENNVLLAQSHAQGSGQ